MLRSMTIIRTVIDIEAPVTKVWDIVSDLDNEPKYWKGTKKIRNLSKNGNTVNREITIAFKDQKCLQEITLHPIEKIQAVFTKGIIKGVKIITLKKKNTNTQLETVWDIKLSGVMRMFTGIVKKHIKKGTEQALQSIKREAER